MELTFPEVRYDARASGRLDSFSITPLSLVSGDYNGNGQLDVADIQLLSEAVRSKDTDSKFDLDADGKVNQDDRRFWVVGLKNTFFGDANLDGEFASSDLVNIFVAGEYEDGVAENSTWASGDWNGDADFTTTDLVLAFTEGGYEEGPRVAVAVPESTGTTLLLSLAASLGCLIRRSRAERRLIRHSAS